MAGYTRQDTTNDISDGKVIDAQDFDDEYNAIEAAFDGSTGHSHDGSTAEGAPITVTGPAQDFVSSGSDFSPKTDSAYTLGTDTVRWSNGYFDEITAPVVSGNSSTATSLETARTITVSGDVSGNASFDGTEDIDITVTVTDGSHNHTLADVTDSGTMAAQDSSAVDIDGGTIDGTPIGASTASTGVFTQINCSEGIISNNDVSIVKGDQPGISFLDTDVSNSRVKLSNANGNARYETDKDLVGGSNDHRFYTAGEYSFRIRTGSITPPVGDTASRPSSASEGEFRRNSEIGAFEGYNGTGWDSLATTDDVANSFPVGGIILWSGSVASIPSGWALCDGTNSTPDLRDRFVVGSGGTYSPDDSGGSADAVVVAHTHDAGTLVTDTEPDHTHQYGVTFSGSGNTSTGGYVVPSNFNVTTGPSGAHSHSVTGSTASEGVSGTNANLPPYYALAFIMKV